MKIKREKKFIASHNYKKEWNIVLGIHPKQERIKTENSNHPFQYVHIWNYGFIDNDTISKMSYLYSGTLGNTKNQRVNIYVINNSEKATYLNIVNPSMYLFHKEKGNDIWECLFFTNNFNNWRDTLIETDDCKVLMKNIVYTLIGCSSVLEL